MKKLPITLAVIIHSILCYSQNDVIPGYAILSDSLTKIIRNSVEYKEEFYSLSCVASASVADGIYRCYGDSLVLAVGTLKNGKLNGPYTTYHENGNKHSSTTMLNDKYDGVTKFYHQNGKLRSVCEFKNGRLWNLNEIYDDKGRKLAKGDFLNGDGKLKLYYSNGKLLRESMMKAGLPDGLTEYYYLDGAIMIKGAFKSGNRTGKWTELSNTGVIYLEHTFK